MKRSWIWAGLFALAAAGWLASGEIAPPFPNAASPKDAAGEKAPPPASDEEARKPFRVEVVTVHLENRRARLKLSAHSEPSESVMVRARTSGVVLRAPLEEGAPVKRGDVLCRLDMADRESRLAAARAALASARRDYEAGLKLLKADHAPEARVRQLKALHDAARAKLRQYELDIAWTKVRAPIDGVLSKQLAREGDLLSPGAPCARVVRLDPLKIVADASEREVGKLALGGAARADLVSGESLRGEISYISPEADPATRTFRLEMTAANPGNTARAGVTASLIIPLPARRAARVPLAAVILNDDGVLGVRYVTADDVVAFAPVKLLEETREGAWISGPPDGARVIVSGQYYVLPGRKVAPTPWRPLKENRS